MGFIVLLTSTMTGPIKTGIVNQIDELCKYKLEKMKSGNHIKDGADSEKLYE